MGGALVLDGLESIQAPQCVVGLGRVRLVAVLGTRSTDRGYSALGETFPHLVRDLASRGVGSGDRYTCKAGRAGQEFTGLSI
ncbi:hypothetical protein D3C85_1632900 [compost metagenome]